MPYLPRLVTLMALAALAAIGALLFAGSQANASPAQGLKDLAKTASPVQPAAYYKRYRRAYVPDYYVNDYAPDYRTYSYRNYGNGHDEIRELQRLFPETNWPPSMRYYHQ